MSIKGSLMVSLSFLSQIFISSPKTAPLSLISFASVWLLDKVPRCFFWENRNCDHIHVLLCLPISGPGPLSCYFWGSGSQGNHPIETSASSKDCPKTKSESPILQVLYGRTFCPLSLLLLDESHRNSSSFWCLILALIQLEGGERIKRSRHTLIIV